MRRPDPLAVEADVSRAFICRQDSWRHTNPRRVGHRRGATTRRGDRESRRPADGRVQTRIQVEIVEARSTAFVGAKVDVKLHSPTAVAAAAEADSRAAFGRKTAD